MTCPDVPDPPTPPRIDDASSTWRRLLAYIRGRMPSSGEGWLALFTAVLVIETGISIKILWTTDNALHKTAEAAQASAAINDRLREITEANDRSWIGPTIAKLSQMEEGKPLEFTITYGNSGKRPASMNTLTGIGHPSAADWDSGYYNATITALSASVSDGSLSRMMSFVSRIPVRTPTC